MINGFLQTVTAHVVAESTNLQATYNAKHIFNIKASANIDNGKVVNLDDMQWVDNEYFTMVQPTSTSRVGLILSVPIGPDERPKAATYEHNFYKERMQGMTLTGLHRDDLIFLVKGKDAKIFASQGQQRLIVIAYKIAELFVFKKIISCV